MPILQRVLIRRAKSAAETNGTCQRTRASALRSLSIWEREIVYGILVLSDSRAQRVHLV